MDVYLWNDKREFLRTIDSLKLLEEALAKLKEKTGISFDEYSDVKLYIEHIKILNQHLRFKGEWKEIFEKAINNNTGLIIIGD